MDPGFDQLELGQAVNKYMHSELHNVIFIHYVLHCFKIRQKMFKSGVFLDKRLSSKWDDGERLLVPLLDKYIKQRNIRKYLEETNWGFKVWCFMFLFLKGLQNYMSSKF